MTPPRHNIQIICNTSLEYFRDVIIGARHYGFESGRIALNDHLDRDISENADLAKIVKDRRIGGIIAQIDDRAMEDRLMALGIPVVNISNVMTHPRLPVVTEDEREVGRMAAAHLSACNCKAFLCCERRGQAFSDERVAGFREGLSRGAAKAPLILLDCPRPTETASNPPKTSSSVGLARQTRNARAQVLSIKKCLQAHARLRPLGIFTVLDIFSLYVMQAAHELGWKIPEHAALLGAGNDTFLVNFENIPLSSIGLPARQIGYKAAQLIDALIQHPENPAPDCRLKPTDVIKRGSTDITFVDDPQLARAMAFIRAGAARGGVGVGAVVKASGLSRSVLQRRFRAQIGRSIRREIQRMRIENAKENLRADNVKISEIAERSGFPSPQRFSVVFRKETGMTPDRYRKNLRANKA